MPPADDMPQQRMRYNRQRHDMRKGGRYDTMTGDQRTNRTDDPAGKGATSASLSRGRLFLLGVTAVTTILPRTRRGAGTLALVGAALAFAAIRADKENLAMAAVASLLALVAIARGVRIKKSEPEAKTLYVHVGGLVAAPVLAIAAFWAAVLVAGFLIVAAAIAIIVALIVLGFRATKEKSPGKTTKRSAASHYNSDGRPKVAYKTLAKAQDAARKYQRDLGGRVTAYKCSECPGFHFGHGKY